MEFPESSPPRKVAIYIRVSKPEQKQEGYSPEHQRRRLLAYINDNKGLNLTTAPELVFEDVGTGANLNRRALDQLRELVRKKKVDAVLVWKIDRLSRNLTHLLLLFEQFQKSEVAFMSLQEQLSFTGPLGRFSFQVFGAVAELERSLIKGRTYAGKLESAEQGNYTGSGIPYGYRKVANPDGKGSKLVLEPKEAKWVKQIFDWSVYDGLGHLKIADKLNDMGVPCRSSGSSLKPVRWSERMINVMLKSPIYFGKHIAVKKDEDGRVLAEKDQTVVWFPACVSEVLFLQAQKARETRLGGFSKHTYLLSSKLYDVSEELPEARRMCGAKRTKGGFSYRRKRFVGLDGVVYPNFEIPAAQLEDFVWSKILSAFKNPAAFVRRYADMESGKNSAIESMETQVKGLRKRVVEINELEMTNVEKAFFRGVISEERFRELSLEYEQALASLAEQIEVIEADIQGLVWARSELDNLKAASAAVTKNLEGLSYEQKAVLCDLFVERVEITKTQLTKKKRQVAADIYFRFNLSRLADQDVLGCTGVDGSVSGIRPSFIDSSDMGGGACRSGYLGIKVSAVSLRSAGLWYKSGQHIPTQTYEWDEAKNSADFIPESAK